MPTATARIEDIETVIVDLPTIRPHQLSMTTMKGQTLMIVRIRTSDGIVGIGEGTTIGGLAYGPESPEGMKVAIDTYITPVLLQSDPNRIGRTMGAINKAARVTTTMLTMTPSSSGTTRQRPVSHRRRSSSSG